MTSLHTPLRQLSIAGLAFSASLLLAACGGDGDSVKQVATGNTTAAITPATGATIVSAVVDKTFTYSAGVAALGTTAATSVKLTGTGASPKFTVSSGASVADGTMAFGSCILTVTTSTFPADSALGVGKTVTVNPCALVATTSGVVADGTSTTAQVALQLGTTASATQSATVAVAADGSVTVNGQKVGTVAIGAATGATGGSN